VKYMRPFGIHSDFGFVPALGGPTNHPYVRDAIIEYSLAYLSNNVQDIGLKWPFRNLYFFSELTTASFSGTARPDLSHHPSGAWHCLRELPF
jgi:hypothetical protein